MDSPTQIGSDRADRDDMLLAIAEIESKVVDCRDREGGVPLGYPYSQNGKKPSKGYAMYKIATNNEEGQVPEITQSLDELARQGARRMILAALELEVEQYVQALRHWRDEQGHAMVVRNGKARQRTVQLGALQAVARKLESLLS